MSAYDRLHPGVQRRLYEMRWENLRPIQDSAIEHLLGDRGDCVISARTAGGKTEAAFLPILSRIADDHLGGVRVLYVSPLKALINDQFRRIEVLCERLSVPVHRWHGDVGEGPRKRLFANPGGILLITPESLEAMFVLRTSQLPALFGKLEFIVIDELHAFIGSPRGAQLQSQLYRLDARCGCTPVRIGLSATLGDPGRALRWMRPGGPEAKRIEDDEKPEIAVIAKAMVRARPDKDEEGDAGEAEEPDDAVRMTLARSILRSCHRDTNLVFANSKGLIEDLADSMIEAAKEMHIAHEVIVHHGSLSKDVREDAEARLRDGRPCTAVCSNTLELGISIGEISNVVQVSPPWSVSSLKQRLGRSGRTGSKPSVLRAFFIQREIDHASALRDRLQLELVQGVAMIELLAENFCEPPEADRAHLSTLVHQILCSLAETGGLKAPELHRRMTACGAFGDLSSGDFATLLRGLNASKLIEQMSDGTLLLGELGERLRDHYSFYAAFRAPEEFRVLHAGHAIGTLPASMIPPPGDHVILAGRRWQVDTVDADAKEVLVTPARGRKAPRFQSAGADLHPRVHAKMWDLLHSDVVPAYLDGEAKRLLAQARDEAARLPPVRPCLEVISIEGVRLHLWAGTRVQRTLGLVFSRAEFVTSDERVAIDIKASPGDVRAVLRTFVEAPDGPALALHADETMAARLAGEKFDEHLPPALWARAYARERLDVERAAELARRILEP